MKPKAGSRRGGGRQYTSVVHHRPSTSAEDEMWNTTRGNRPGLLSPWHLPRPLARRLRLTCAAAFSGLAGGPCWMRTPRRPRWHAVVAVLDVLHLDGAVRELLERQPHLRQHGYSFSCEDLSQVGPSRAAPCFAQSNLVDCLPRDSLWSQHSHVWQWMLHEAGHRVVVAGDICTCAAQGSP